ncbi:MAG: hypothetical protein WBF33_28815 [Candidatus Nitrosopolaris sp.]
MSRILSFMGFSVSSEDRWHRSFYGFSCTPVCLPYTQDISLAVVDLVLLIDVLEHLKKTVGELLLKKNVVEE